MGKQYFKEDNNTIILITQKKKTSKKDLNNTYLFEPLICLRFSKKPPPPKKKRTSREPKNDYKALSPIYKFNYSKITDTESYRPIISSLIDLVKVKCDEVNKEISNEIFENNLEDLYSRSQNSKRIK